MTQTPPPIRDAATTIVMRGDRVLMGRRQSGAVFFPDKFVFPGGRVDAADEAAPFDALLDPRCREALSFETVRAPEVFGVAALRELYEETGLVPNAPDLPMRFVYRAITPPDMPRRFDARFFVIQAGDLTGDLDDLSPPEDELSDLQWLTLDQAITYPIADITRDVLRHLIQGVPADVVPWRVGDRADRITRLIPR